jgi:hypothetical protein
MMDRKMNKPIKDWTLEEVHNYCLSLGGCKGCKLSPYNDCIFSPNPSEWALPGPPQAHNTGDCEVS